MSKSLHLKSQLTHTWPVFFAHYGNFTEVQRQAIPAILEGENTLLVAATAAGKTEAAIAPLLERLILQAEADVRSYPALRILYICPTRALTRDLYERLRLPLETLNIELAMKSGDTAAVSTSHPPNVLITTPESTDSLLTRAPRLLTTLHAIVLEEIHLFGNSPRGDHLRCLLRRIEHVRAYRQQELGNVSAPLLQRVALSATVPDTHGVAQRYLLPITDRGEPSPTATYRIIHVAGTRKIDAEIVAMRGLADLVRALAQRSASQAIRKSLIFCNTRNEVEQVAAYLRKRLPFTAAVFVHYSNLDATMRLQVETDFAASAVAICVATTTLELGIDIGSIDDVVLVGPPPTITSFLQRIGRGGRRTGITRVLCLPRSPLEEARFHALLETAQSPGSAVRRPIPHSPNPKSIFQKSQSPTLFRPSVLVQQIFSILKQSPTGAIRLADLRRVTPIPMSDAALRDILANLVREDYLQSGRAGEWRPGPALDELLERHEIYSNIGADPLAALLVDAYTGRTIAQIDRIKAEGDTLLLGGQTMEVVWRDRYRLGVRSSRNDYTAEEVRLKIAPFAVPLDVTQAVAAHLGLRPGELCLLHDAEGAWLFHFWGDLYGELLAALLQVHFAGDADARLVEVRNELCLHIPTPLAHLPAWEAARAERQLRILLPRIEPFLELGRFHSLLPAGLAHQTALALCDLPTFARIYQSAELVTPASGLRARLQELL